ncbi:MAG: D-alanyl-D-alanine carboxypeptidase family protein [Lachnospira sp.]
MNYDDDYITIHENRKRRSSRIKRQRDLRIKKLKIIAGAVLLIVLTVSSVCLIINLIKSREKAKDYSVDNISAEASVLSESDEPTEEEGLLTHPDYGDVYYGLSDEEFACDYIAFLDTDNNKILAGKSEQERINPASMTKVMTLVVCVEQLDLQNKRNETYTFTRQNIDELYLAEASVVGYIAGETVGVNDLLYGLILPSGADAALALANIISGGDEGFVELMNKKAEELGLKETHFTNSIGLYDENHYTTPVEMAMIMQYAMTNEECAKILSTTRFTTSPTKYHKDGILLLSTVSTRFGSYKPDNVTLQGGKTGFTDEAGYCMVVSLKSLSGDRNFVLLMSHGKDRYDPSNDIKKFINNYYNNVITGK